MNQALPKTDNPITTDYLVIGAGAMGVAFADEVITRDKTAEVVLVDKHSQPGGHWNDAYPFVKLHQPAAYYGVNSEKLGPGGDTLVSGTEVLAYFERVMEKLLATGRVRYFPQCESNGDCNFHSLLDEQCNYQVTVRRKIVDATYMKVEVPSVCPPKFEVADGVALVPVNGLADIDKPWSKYVIIGAGKTGIDAVLLLLGRGVSPEHIDWIMPNDSWLDNRKNLAPGNVTDGLYHIREWLKGNTLKEVFLEREKTREVFRLDKSIWPTKYKCATVSEPEHEQLLRIKNIVRLGRVIRIQPNSIELEQGTIPTDVNHLHVDCTADGLARREPRPVFEAGRISLQSLAQCQQVFSAALTGYIETRFKDDTSKNALCQVVPHPEHTQDWVRTMKASNDNSLKWGAKFPLWMLRSRLSYQSHESLWKTLVAAIRLRKEIGQLNKLLISLTEQEFPDSTPATGSQIGTDEIYELTEGLWGLSCQVAPAPGMKIGTRMTIVKLEDNTLLLHSPIKLDARQVSAINELGSVQYLVSPNLLHHLSLTQATTHWPAAKVWAAPGLAAKIKGIRVDEVLAADSSLAGIDVLPIDGCPQLQEFAFFHRASSTLVLTDLVFNEATGHNIGGRLFLRASGAYGRFAVSKVVKSMIKDRTAFGRSLAAVLDLPFERIVMAHGEIMEKNAKQRFQELMSTFIS